MSEKALWSLVRSNLALRMFRVENRVAAGMPDVHYVIDSENGYIIDRKSGWIELKYIEKFPKKGKVNIGLRKSQDLWIQKYTSMGGQCYILLRVGREKIFLINGKHSNILHKMPNHSAFLELPCWSHCGNMKEEDWKDLKFSIAHEK